MGDGLRYPPGMNQERSRGGRKGFILWAIAIVLMAGAYAYQKRTGPTHPKKGSIVVGDADVRYELLRSHETTGGAPISVPSPDGKVTGTLHWKNYPTKDAFTAMPMKVTEVEGESVLQATLPTRPAAGKIEYYLELTTPGGPVRIPEAGGENEILLRYKDPVPDWILWPHIIAMFFTMLIGMRAGLSALFQQATMRRYAWTTLAIMSTGGLVLGPIVQKYAFGAYWTGFPWGYDLTDNKLLIMWVVWLIACVWMGGKTRADGTTSSGLGRVGVILASVVMVVVYLIPHSMQGSELDYDKLKQGVDPKQAIGTGGK